MVVEPEGALLAKTSGVVVHFNRAADVSVLNLYDSGGGILGPADIAVDGASSGPVVGSLIIDATATNSTFMKTGGPLLPDTYTITLRSATNGFKDLQGHLLDGNENGVPGDSYVAQFTVALSSNRLLSLPDFARGPGQPVNLPVTTNGIPLIISDGSNVLTVSLTIQYDTNLLRVIGISLGDTLPGNWTLTNGIAIPGILQLSAGGATPLAPGSNTFATIQAQVPWCATYGSLGIISLNTVQINGGAIPGAGDSAVHAVAFIGDTTGNHSYEIQDAQNIGNISVGLGTGFTAYPLVDPIIIGDVSNDGCLTIFDAALVAQKVAGPLAAGIIPDIQSPLLIAITNNQVLISWPQCADGYILERSPALGTQANWATITNAPVIDGDRQRFTLDAMGQTQFYRMRK